MKEYEIVAVLHDERRNNKRCAKYWAVESDPECERDSDYEIYDQWFCWELPKRILAVLNTAPDDPEEWGYKRGFFIATLEKPIVFEDYGHVQDFKNIISIKIVATETTQKYLTKDDWPIKSNASVLGKVFEKITRLN